MKKPLPLYFLYCLNMHCKASIYHHMEALQVPFTAENLAKDHTCIMCNRILLSAIDFNIKKLIIGANQQININISLSTK